jgi:glycosyltransferase involved in cell wall biosynthesis
VHIENESGLEVKGMSRLRVLVLAPDCNPDSITGPLISYCQAEALAQLHDVTLAFRSPYEDAIRRRQAPFHAFEVIRLPLLELIYSWTLRRIFKNNYRNQGLTAFGYPFALAFEWRTWRQMRQRIFAGEFDAVLRLMPITVVLPSLFSFLLRRGPIPFIIGPINGSLPWPQGFSQADSQKQWISPLRNLYRFLPFARSTYRDAAAINAGSSHTFAELATYRDKLFYLPENGISLSLFPNTLRAQKEDGKLELIFVGALVPYKGCDLALRAAASLLRRDLARITVVGDGPERQRLEQLATDLGIHKAVSFCGSVDHAETITRMGLADVLLFPSVREFGGAVVFEALAAGAVPVVADFGGPGDIVYPEVGYKVPLTNEKDVAAQMEKILEELAVNRELLGRLRRQGMSYARERLSWDAKAQTISRIIAWATGHGPKPNLPPPKTLADDSRSRVGRLEGKSAASG